jgi:hypothetical protein
VERSSQSGRTLGSQDVHVVPQRTRRRAQRRQGRKDQACECARGAVAKPPADFENTTCISCNEGEALLYQGTIPSVVSLKMYKLNAKHTGRQWDLADERPLRWTVHTVDARQRSRNSTDWIVLTTTSTTCLQNVASCCTTCNFIKLNLDMLTFLRRCHHIHHLNIGADGRGLSTGVAAYSGPLVKIASTLSEDKRLATRRTRHSSRLTTSCASTVGSAGGIDRYDACTVYVIGNMVPCCTECNFMKGAAWRRLLGTVCVSPHGHMHRVDEAGVVRYRIAARGFM